MITVDILECELIELIKVWIQRVQHNGIPSVHDLTDASRLCAAIENHLKNVNRLLTHARFLAEYKRQHNRENNEQSL